MAPTSTKCIDKIIYQGFLIIALGATIIKDIESNSLLEWWMRIHKPVFQCVYYKFLCMVFVSHSM
jgi:hypothetical protein